MKAKSKKKNVKNHIVYLVVSILILTAVVALGVYIYPYANNDFIDTSMAVTSDDIATNSGYAVDGDVYTPQSEDSYLEFGNAVTQVTTLEVYFNETLEADETAVIYYANPENAEKWIAEEYTFPAGNSAFEIPMEKIGTGSFRISTDGAFSLNQFVICGILVRNDVTKTLLIYMVFLIVLIVLIVFFIRSGDGRTAWNSIIELFRHLPTGLQKLFGQINGTVYQFGVKHQFRIERFFVVFALLMGLFISIIIPAGQTPDEGAHFQQIMGETGIGGVYEQYCEYLNNIKAGEMMTHTEIPQDWALYKQYATQKIDWSRASISFHPTIKILCHLPATIGIVLGMILHLPILFILQLGELGALLFFLFCGWKALKLMPVKKELFCFIMLLPMSIQQCTSLNYDSVLLPVSYLLVAYIFYCKYEAEKVGWKQFGVIAALSFVVLLVKAPYVLIAGTVFLIPSKKIILPIGDKTDLISLWKKFWYLAVLAFAGLFAAGCYVCRDVPYFKILESAVMHFPRYITLMCSSIIQKLKIYEISFAGDFGWMDTIVENSFIVLIIVMLFVLSQTKTKYDKKRGLFCIGNRIFFAVLFFGLLILIHTIMLTWTYQLANLSLLADVKTYGEYLYQVTVVEGVQGRYLIPFILFLLLPFDGILPTKQENMTVIQIMYYICAVVCVTGTIYTRYWM